MELKEGRQIGRGEFYITAHTRKNGQPIDEYSFEKIDEIQRRFQEDPSLINEDTHDNDLFSTLFPKERSARRAGLGLLAGGVGSARICEALFEVQEVKEENKKLWDVVKTLMSNQTKLEQQYSELKSQVSAPQTSPTETSPRIGTIAGQHLQDMNDGNQGSTSHSNRRHRVEPEEAGDAMMQSLQKIKREKEEHTLLGNAKEKAPPQSLPETSKKPRRFQTPLHKDDMERIKCGMEVGLASPNSKELVVLGTIQKTDRKAKAKDGQPLADFIEVLVSIVYKQTTILPRAHGKIQYLGSATAHCIPWPRQNIICADDTSLHSKFCSSMDKVTLNTRETPGPKMSTSKPDANMLNKGQVTSQSLPESKKSRKKASKEKEQPQSVEGHKCNVHITSRC